MRRSGTVRFFNAGKGFGLIQPDRTDKDVFVQVAALQAAGIVSLREGDRVTFELEDDKLGRGKQASELRKV
jgi:cold shock protein